MIFGRGAGEVAECVNMLVPTPLGLFLWGVGIPQRAYEWNLCPYSAAKLFKVLVLYVAVYSNMQGKEPLRLVDKSRVSPGLRLLLEPWGLRPEITLLVMKRTLIKHQPTNLHPCWKWTLDLLLSFLPSL